MTLGDGHAAQAALARLIGRSGRHELGRHLTAGTVRLRRSDAAPDLEDVASMIMEALPEPLQPGRIERTPDGSLAFEVTAEPFEDRYGRAVMIVGSAEDGEGAPWTLYGTAYLTAVSAEELGEKRAWQVVNHLNDRCPSAVFGIVDGSIVAVSGLARPEALRSRGADLAAGQAAETVGYAAGAIRDLMEGADPTEHPAYQACRDTDRFRAATGEVYDLDDVEEACEEYRSSLPEEAGRLIEVHRLTDGRSRLRLPAPYGAEYEQLDMTLTVFTPEVGYEGSIPGGVQMKAVIPAELAEPDAARWCRALNGVEDGRQQEETYLTRVGSGNWYHVPARTGRRKVVRFANLPHRHRRDDVLTAEIASELSELWTAAERIMFETRYSTGAAATGSGASRSGGGGGGAGKVRSDLGATYGPEGAAEGVQEGAAEGPAEEEVSE